MVVIRAALQTVYSSFYMNYVKSCCETSFTTTLGKYMILGLAYRRREPLST